MKKSRSLFSQLQKKAILYGLVDEGGWLSQMLASRKTIAEHTKLTKNFLRNQRNLRQKIRVNPCSSVVNFSYFAQYDIRITQYGSIKIERLCETKPISEMPKILVTAVYTMTNNKKQRTINYQKQTQTKPNFGLFNFLDFPYNGAIDRIR